MTPPPLCTETDAQHCEWDDPLTRLLLLLEIADRPTWLRDVAAAGRQGGEAGHCS
ncbi:hypothetical protein N566_01665 [Streptomycetaceae bacterium MP113-05]|nr:hypothetical protein N566_01665 [Streptomycetaceae bacterium MP113-05]